MKFKEIIGIDISKSKLDVRIHSTQDFRIFDNSNPGFNELKKWVSKNSSCSLNETLFVMEHTGRYSHNLSLYLAQKTISFKLVAGLEVKRSLGIQRGKDDKIDATKIALYGYRLRDEIEPTLLPGNELLKLKRLLSLRKRMVRYRAGFKASLREDKAFLPKKGNSQFFKYQENMIYSLSREINKIEAEMFSIVDASDKLSIYFELITSIKGIGPLTALYIIVYTDGFIKFNDARKFASYVGIAPFPNKSGSSLSGKTRVSHLANKEIKSLLELYARTAILYNPEMKKYYLRRLEKGKNKTSTLNISRNKLLARVFAVVKRGTPYVDIYKFAA